MNQLARTHAMIVSEHHGHWSAWLEGRPETAFGGDTPANALQRLCDTTLGFDVDSLVLDRSKTTDGRHVFAIGHECPDCGGTGHYTGLNETSDCWRGHGCGRT